MFLYRKYKDANLLGGVEAESEGEVDSPSLPGSVTSRAVIHREAVDSGSLDSEEEIDTGAGEIRRYGVEEVRKSFWRLLEVWGGAAKP